MARQVCTCLLSATTGLLPAAMLSRSVSCGLLPVWVTAFAPPQLVHMPCMSPHTSRRSSKLNACRRRLPVQVMKDRCAALQCQLERMREQLVAAEGDNTSLRADLAGLLGARQEANTVREKLRQVQLDSSRRITELEADAADMSQQIMVSGRGAVLLECCLIQNSSCVDCRCGM